MPYGFIDEFIYREIDWLKSGGKFVVPLPEPMVISYDDVKMILPEADYIKVMSSVPIVCVDGLVVNSKKEFLLVKRKMNHLKMNFGCLAADYLKMKSLFLESKEK